MKKYWYCILFFSFTALQAQEDFDKETTSFINCNKSIQLNEKAFKQTTLDSALFYVNEALASLSTCRNDSVKAATIYNKAFLTYKTENYEQAAKLFDDLKSFSQENNIPYYVYRSYTYLGKTYNMLGKEKIGLDNYQNALNITMKMKDSLLIGDAYNNIGDAYKTLNLDKEAKKYFLLALNIYDKAKVDEKEKYITYKNLARVSNEIKNIEFYMNKALLIVSKENDASRFAAYYLTKGDAFGSKNHYKEALKAFKTAYKISDSIGFNHVANISLMGIGQNYNNLGEYDKALTHLNKALNYDQPNKQNYLILLNELSKTYSKKEDYKKALSVLTEYNKIKDSLSDKKTKEAYAKFDVKFKTEQKNKTIVQQQLELEKQKNRLNNWIIGSLIFIILGAILFQWLYYKQRKKQLRAETKLLIQEKINDLRSKFVENITHELRTPLSIISGKLELALTNIHNKEKLTENLNSALNNSKKVIVEANEMLELMRLDKDKSKVIKTLIPLNKTLKRIFLSISSLAQIKKISLKYISDIPDDTQIQTDEYKLEKILNNLISNAIKHSSSGKEIIFDTQLVNNLLTIKVTDFGQGIHAIETEKIFERFYQSSKNKTVGGMGIGLSLAKEYAELLKGNLSVKSEVGKGSTFIFNLPVETSVINNKTKRSEASLHNKSLNENTIETAEKEEHQHKIIYPAQNDKKPNILIVEDNPEMAEFLNDLLTEQYNCMIAFNGKEALKLIKKKYFDLITSDIMMPEMDGFELRKKLYENEIFRKIPFILISAKTLPEDKIKGFKLGIDDYIVKPFNKDELLARIKNLITNKYKREKWSTNNIDFFMNTDSSEEKLLKKLEQIVLKNIDNENFNVKTLSSEIGYSQRQLSRILNKCIGISPLKFILEIRLQKAYQLLQNKTHFSLSEVRYEVGILTPSYFNKKFKERFGINPSELLS